MVCPNRIGQTYAITYSPDHVWYWFPRMRRHEALVFKTYDSLDDGRARWTAHTAFHDPTAASDARPRVNIEIRTLAFFEVLRPGAGKISCGRWSPRQFNTRPTKRSWVDLSPRTRLKRRCGDSFRCVTPIPRGAACG
jgi:hypothetical protein